MIQSLASNGSLLNDKFMVETPERRGSISDIVKQMKTEISTLTPEQIKIVDEIESIHYQVRKIWISMISSEVGNFLSRKRRFNKTAHTVFFWREIEKTSTVLCSHKYGSFLDECLLIILLERQYHGSGWEIGSSWFSGSCWTFGTSQTELQQRRLIMLRLLLIF